MSYYPHNTPVSNPQLSGEVEIQTLQIELKHQPFGGLPKPDELSPLLGTFLAGHGPRGILLREREAGRAGERVERGGRALVYR